MTEESYSFDSLQEYKDARRIMQLFHDCGESVAETVRVFAEQNGCTEKTAYEKLTAAWQQRNRLLPTPDNDEGEDREQDDDLFPDHWDYVGILWAGMEAEKVDQAFRQLSYRDQTLLEQRNAICMNCGRVSSMSTQASFVKRWSGLASFIVCASSRNLSSVKAKKSPPLSTLIR